MRIKKNVEDLQVGDVAYLPVWGDLLKSKVLQVSINKREGFPVDVSVLYKPLSYSDKRSPNYCDSQMQCVFMEVREVEVYTRAVAEDLEKFNND